MPRIARRYARWSASWVWRTAPARCSRPTRSRRFARCRRCSTPASRACCGGSSARCFASRSRVGAVSLRLEMLQVARLAPTQLGESRDLVAAFLRERAQPGRRFSGSHRRERPVLHRLRPRRLDRASGNASRRTNGCVSRSLRRRRGSGFRARRLPGARLGRAPAPLRQPRSSIRDLGADRSLSQRRWRLCHRRWAPYGSAYAAFLALGAYQDLGRALPEPERGARIAAPACAPPTAATPIIPGCRPA